MYQGPTDQVPEFFGARGHPNPPHYNPADWVMNVAQSVSKEQLEKDGFFEKDARELGDAFKGDGEGKDALGITITSHDAAVDYDESHVGFSTQAYMLYTREFRNLRRDTRAVGARIGLTSFLAILVGIIFLHVGKQDPSIKENQQSQFGALVIVLLMVSEAKKPIKSIFYISVPVFIRTDVSELIYLRGRLSFKVHVWNSPTFADGFPGRTSCFLAGVLNEPLFCCAIFLGKVYCRVNHHRTSDLGTNFYHLLYGGISTELWHFLCHCSLSSHD